MATQSRKTGPESFTGNQSAEDFRAKFIEAPLQGTQQSVLSSGLELANLLNILPGAFVSSQERELERLQKSGKDNDPRIATLQASIEQTELLRSAAQLAQARIERLVPALGDREDLFHGFVSDANLEPLKGLTVRLVDSNKTRKAKNVSEKTDNDGYFRIPLGAKRAAKGRAKASEVNLSDRLTNLFSSASETPNAAASSSDDSRPAAQVEVLKKGKVIYRDPELVPLERGTVYREYVISSDRPPSTADFREFMSQQKPNAEKAPVVVEKTLDGKDSSSPKATKK